MVGSERLAPALATPPAVAGTSGHPAIERPASPLFKAVRWILVIIVPILLWFAPLGLDPLAQHALSISSFMIGAWITRALEYAIAGLIGCYLFWALGIASFELAFSGFANNTPWFLFGAILFGMMADKSGLARRLAYMVMRTVGSTYARLLLGIIIADFLLTFIVPSGIARVVLMATVALGLLEAAGAAPGSNMGRGMFILLTYKATIFDKMIIAGAASITARGLIERIGGVDVLWSQWFLAYLPCDLITIFVAWRVALWLYPVETARLADGQAHFSNALKKMGPWSVLEKRSAALMGVAMLFWMTDFLHPIAPPMIGLGVGLIATLPRIGVLGVEDVKRVNFLPVFFVATALGMSRVLEATKGLDVITDVLFAWMTPLITNVYQSTMVLYWSAFVYHIFMGDEISMLSTSIPPLMNFAKTHGHSPLELGMIWTFAAGGKIFIYQSAVLVVGYSYGYFDSRDMFRVGLILTIVQAIILLLLVPFYWPLIGI